MKKGLLILIFIIGQYKFVYAQIFMEDFSTLPTIIAYPPLGYDPNNWSYDQSYGNGSTATWQSTNNILYYSYDASNYYVDTFLYAGASNGFAEMYLDGDDFAYHSYFTSPEFNCVGQNQVFLSFANQYTSLGCAFGGVYVDVSNGSGGYGSYNVTYGFDTIDISSIAANQSEVYFEFRYFYIGILGCTSIPVHNSWVIDDIKVYNPSCNILHSIIHSNGSTDFCQGDSLELIHDSTSTGVSFQWYKNDSLMIAGATQSYYWASDSGVYSCKISDTCGYVFSNKILLTMEITGIPQITFSGNLAICAGSTKNLNLPYSSYYTYQWMYNGVSIPLTNISSYPADTSGNYSCLLINSCGSFYSDTVALIIAQLPTAVIDTVIPYPVCYPTPFSLIVQPVINCTYLWYRNTLLTGDSNIVITSIVAGNYLCVVTDSNACSSTSNTIYATCFDSLANVNSNGPTTFCQGASVTLNANATSGLTYQWTRNGNNISGATQQSYVATATGVYRADVDNGICTVVSNPIIVSVPCLLQQDKGSGSVLRQQHINELTISIDEESSIRKIEVINVLGENVFKSEYKNPSSEITIDVGNLSTGIYFVTLTTDKGSVVKKFIRQ
jgi:hypothetical protein